MLSRIAQLREYYRTARFIIGAGYGRDIAVLVILMTFTALFHTLSIGSLLPVLMLMGAPEEAAQSEWFLAIQGVLGDVTPDDLIFLFVLLLFLFSALGTILGLYLVYKQRDFVQKFYAQLGTRVLRNYLSRDYLYFLKHNSAVLLKHVITESQLFAEGVILHALLLAANIFVIVFLCVFLVIIEPLINGGILLFSVLFVAVVYRFSRARVQRWGGVRQIELGHLQKIAHQALTGIKEVKALGCEEAYLQDFSEHFGRYADVNIKYQVINGTTNQFVNIVVTLFLAFFALYAFINRIGLSEALTSLSGVVALGYAGLYRIMPAFSSAVKQFVHVVYYWSSAKVLEEALSDSEGVGAFTRCLPDSIEGFRFSRQLRFEGVNYRYPESDAEALHDVSLRINFGEVVAFAGESGAGKTTMVDLVLGLLQPTQGAIYVDDQPLTPDKFTAWRCQIGYVPQQIFLADATLRENVLLGMEHWPLDEARLQWALQTAGLQPVIAKLPQGVETPLGEGGARLSGGERQRIGIARALYRRPRLLVMDEATSALDSVIEGEILNDIFKLRGETTVIIISHRIASLRPVDKLFVFQHGRLVADGDYDNLLAQSPLFARLAQEPTA